MPKRTSLDKQQSKWWMNESTKYFHNLNKKDNKKSSPLLSEIDIYFKKFKELEDFKISIIKKYLK